MADLSPWAVLGVFMLGAAVTYAWRWMGVLLSGRIDVQSPLFTWVGCVAYALLAGLIARMIVLPAGALQDTALEARLASAAVALAIFFVTRRNILLGVLAGTAALVGMTAGGHPLG